MRFSIPGVAYFLFLLSLFKYFSLKHLDIKEKSRIFAVALKITLKGKQYECSYK